MCGIVGINSSKQISSLDEQSLKSLIGHRGPDAQGRFQGDGVWMGHTRLAIIDLDKRGNQPMVSPCGRYTIVFNGEIYNFIELRQDLEAEGVVFSTSSDTEVLLHALVLWGEAALLKLRGVFAFALWDEAQKELWLARDRFGEKPLYYTLDDGRFIFSSELKAITRLMKGKKQLCPVGVNLFLHYQFVYEPHTIVKGVFKLERAHHMRVAHGEIRETKQYWNFDDIKPVDEDPIDVIRQSLETSMKRMLRSDAKLGIALSAGIDSSLLLSMAAKEKGDGIECYSVGYPGRPPYDERDDAAAFAKQKNAEFFDIELENEHFTEFFPNLIDAMDDPIADIAAFGHFSVAKLASEKGAKVMLSGLGGDELFWGYAWPPEAVRLTQNMLAGNMSSPVYLPFIRPFANLRGIRRFIPANIKAELNNPVRSLPSEDYAVFYNIAPDFMDSRRFGESALISTTECDFDLPFEKFRLTPEGRKNVPNFINQCLFDGWLVANCLALTDRVSMHNGVEARVPFLDHDLVDLVFGLRMTHNDVNAGNKHWLKQAISDLVPETILNRPKKGFTPPVTEWMFAVFRKYREEILQGSEIFEFFKREDVIKLFEHAERTAEGLQIVYKLLILHLWSRQNLQAEI